MPGLGKELKLEAHEESPEVPAILVDAMVLLLDLRLLQEAKHLLLELARAFAVNDLDHIDLLAHSLGNDAVQRLIDLPATIVDFV